MRVYVEGTGQQADDVIAQIANSISDGELIAHTSDLFTRLARAQEATGTDDNRVLCCVVFGEAAAELIQLELDAMARRGEVSERFAAYGMEHVSACVL